MATGKKFKVQAQGEIRIVLELPKANGYIGLTHIFRIPTAEDKVAYYQKFSATELTGDGEKRQIKPRIDYWGGINVLYDRCIIGTEDYVFPEGLENWKDYIPLEHKVEAAELLLKKTGVPLKAEKVKN